MKKFLIVAFGGALMLSNAWAQEITPVWVQRINGLVNVAEADKLPILVLPTAPVVAAPGGVLLDGREPLAHFTRLIPFSLERLLLAVRENGIDEQDPNLPQAQRTLAEQYPDRSLIWIEAATGKALGLAWKESLRAADVIGYDVMAPGTGFQTSEYNQLWRPALDENPDPTKRAIYSGYKHLILRYAPKADGTGWETTPTIAWEEPVPGQAEDGSITPEAGIGDGLSGTASEGGEQGSWRAFRWRNIRVTGSGTDTLIYAGGGTWRIGSHPQVFATTNGSNFYPIARVNDRDGARRNAYSLGGTSSRVIKPGTDPLRPNLEVVYHGHYPGTGWEARPNRYTSDPNNPTPSPEYNQQPNVRLFSQDEAGSGAFPKFVWEAAGKDGLPLNRGVDGVDVYDGNWNMALDTAPGLDYLVGVSAASYDVGFFTYAWLAVHRLDGSIASGNSSYQIPVREDTVIVDYTNLGSGEEPDFDTTESMVDVVPDPSAPANLDKAWVLAAFANGGFGLFNVQNVAATLVTSPTNQTVAAGADVTIAANVTGSPNSFQWYHNGVPVPSGPYFLGARKAVLKITGVTPGDAGIYQLKWTNPLSGAGQTAPITLDVTGNSVRWAATTDIQADPVNMPIMNPGELTTNAANSQFTMKAYGYSAFDNAQAVGDNGMFRYENVTGDFDKRVRLVSLAGDVVDPAPQWPRASLMVRESTGPRSQALEIAAADPAGANAVRVMGRARTDQVYSQTLSRTYAGVGDNLPNQWLRVRRVGDAFSFYVSTNGTNWSLVSQQYQNMPDTVLVGTYVAPDDVTGFLAATAEFADYGDFMATDTTAPRLLSAGTIDNKLVGLKFSEQLNSTSASMIENYSISQGSIVSAMPGINGSSVYLRVAGLTSDTFTVTVLGGVVDTAGNPVAPNSTVSAKKSNWTSTDIGYIQNPTNRPTAGDDPYLVGQAVAVSSTTNPELELIGGGSNGWNSGDYIHYLYREYPGDFDVVVAVDRFDRRGIAGGYANGGIQVRKALYRTDNTDIGEITKVPNYLNITYYEASAPNRASIQINRPAPGDGYGNSNPFANTEEIDGLLGYFPDLRATDAAGTIDPKSSPDQAKWLRVTRTNTTYTSYFSYDGKTWKLMEDATKDMENLNGTVLVGFSHINDSGAGTPPTGNTYAGNGTVDAEGNPIQNESNYGVLRISHFGDLATAFEVPVETPTISLTREGDVWRISYTGTLQSSSTAGGGYTDVQGASSPYTMPVGTGTAQFYRARN
jgi:hypothetical protein